MPSDPPGSRPAAPVVLRIKLRYDDVDAMVNRFAPNVGKSGLFLPTKSLQPVGAEVKFELRLSNDTPVLLGLGRVKVTKPPDPANPKASFGMAIELMRVTRESRDLILRMLERRKQLGLAEVAIPMPADLDAARRSDMVDTGVREVRDPVSSPIATVSAHVDSAPSEALLTAPRRQSGPMAIAKVTVIDPLPPEPARRKRPMLAELIERASGPIGAVIVPGLDEDVDVGAVLARARILAGGDLDAELEALREAQATPIEISIEAASAELARQLGGAAVRRDSRGHAAPTGWAPPPAVAAKSPVDELPAGAAVEATPDAIVESSAVTTPVTVEPAPTMMAPEAADTMSDPAAAAAALGDDFETRTPAVFEMITAVSGLPARTPVPDLVPEPDEPPDDEPPEEHEVEADQIHDEIHQLGEADFEEVEHTHIGAMTPSFEEHVFKTTPSMQAELAQKLDAHLAEVEADGEVDDLGIGEASGIYPRSKVGLPPAQIYDGDDQPDLDVPAEPVETKALPPEYQEDFIHDFGAERASYREAELATPELAAAEPAYSDPELIDPEETGEPAYAEPAQSEDDAEPGYDPGQPIDAYGQTMDASLLGAEPREQFSSPGDAARDDGLAGEEIEEIDDFEILAEADEEDADLLSSSGEADASGSAKHTLPPAGEPDFAMPPLRESDFAMRLDLPDDDEPAIPQQQDDLAASAGHALAAFEEEE
ncbi:MAG: hypothetical protein H0V17_27925, partial [Deltaproteobacteria bacterium]|nr:hypothetical protein [Deltaproteobacteria bacterium]